MIASLICIAGVAGGFHGNRLDYPFQGGQIDLGRAAEIDGLCIVSPVRRLDLSTRPSVFNSNPALSVNTEVATVLSSLHLQRGGTVHITTLWDATDGVPAGSPPYRLVPGRRYLVVATLPKNGNLTYPHAVSAEPQEDAPYVPAAYPDEVSGLAVFETHQSALSSGDDAAEVLCNSIADCLIGADSAAAQRVYGFLLISGYANMSKFKAAMGQPDFPFSLRLREIAKSEPPSIRGRIYELLNQWSVYGSAQLYIETIEDCAKDPKFEGWPWMRDPSYFEDPNAGPGLPPGVSYVFRADRWAEAVVTAKSDVALKFLLRNNDGAASASYELKLAKLLDNKDPEVRERIAFYFSWFHKDMARAPKAVETRDPVTNEVRKAYPGLDEIVKYWKQQILGQETKA